MAWEWHPLKDYAVSSGTEKYYGIVKLRGDRFTAVLYFHKVGPLKKATVSSQAGIYFTGHMDYQQMQMFVDLLRNESPVRFGWSKANPSVFQLMTGEEPVGDGDEK